MKRLLAAEKAASKFDQAFQTISLSTWNRKRTSNELKSFIERRELVLEDIEL